MFSKDEPNCSLSLYPFSEQTLLFVVSLNFPVLFYTHPFSLTLRVVGGGYGKEEPLSIPFPFPSDIPVLTSIDRIESLPSYRSVFTGQELASTSIQFKDKIVVNDLIKVPESVQNSSTKYLYINILPILLYYIFVQVMSSVV